MITFLIIIIRFILDFLSNIWGIFNTPYKTAKKIVNQKKVLQALIILSVIPLYTAFSTPIKYGLKPGPVFLFLVFLRSTLWTLSTYFLACFALYLVSQKLTSKKNFLGFFSIWSFSLIPTYIWFFTTSFLYFLLPPPRTSNFEGIIFSLLFIAFSLSLLFWKLILYYLALRFAANLSLTQIITASIILFPLGSLYSLITYKLGIFKIPFI